MLIYRRVLKRRPDLHLIVSSATLDAEQFRDFFNTNTSGNRAQVRLRTLSQTHTQVSLQDSSVIISVEGRQYPVDVYYLGEPTQDYIQAAVDTVIDLHETEPAGDILVFLTGAEEIETTVELIRDRAASYVNCRF